MDDYDVRDAVDLVTGKRQPLNDIEREKLRKGDELLAAVVKYAHNKFGHPLNDVWGGHEPPEDRPRRNPGDPLTFRMRQVAQMTLDGYTFPEIGAELGIDAETVRSHMTRLRKATGEEKTWRAALMAALWGWLD